MKIHVQSKWRVVRNIVIDLLSVADSMIPMTWDTVKHCVEAHISTSFLKSVL